jgi:hypothetical protein
MVGATWLALVLRTDVLNGVNYNMYFSFSSSESYGKSTPTGGAGFGMVNADTGKPWYPYYVHQMIGKNLAVNDAVVQANCSSGDVRTLAWVHGQTLNLLLICKVNQARTVYLSGLQGLLNMSKIDNNVSWTTPRIQTSTIDSKDSLILDGYTVALLQMPFNF